MTTIDRAPILCDYCRIGEHGATTHDVSGKCMAYLRRPRVEDDKEAPRCECFYRPPATPISEKSERENRARIERYVRSSYVRSSVEPPRSQAEIEEKKYEQLLAMPDPKPFTDEEITAMARMELEGELPEAHARFLATTWERDKQIESLRRRK